MRANVALEQSLTQEHTGGYFIHGLYQMSQVYSEVFASQPGLESAKMSLRTQSLFRISVKTAFYFSKSDSILK